MKSIAAIALLYGIVTVGQVNAETCYAVAFSGGKENGAYQAGVVSGLVNTLPADEVAYSVVSGV